MSHKKLTLKFITIVIANVGMQDGQVSSMEYFKAESWQPIAIA